MTDWGLCFFDGGTGIAMGHFDEKRSPCLKKTYFYRFKKHIIMVSFLLAIVLLLLGYLLYSRVIERIVESSHARCGTPRRCGLCAHETLAHLSHPVPQDRFGLK